MSARKTLELTEKTYNRVIAAAKQRACDPSTLIAELLEIDEMEKRRQR